MQFGSVVVSNVVFFLILALFAAFTSGRSLRLRIQRVLDESVSRSMSRGTRIALTLFCLAIAPMSLVGNEPEDEPQRPDTSSSESAERGDMRVIIGSVLAESGKPVANAQVCRAYSFSKATSKRKLATTRSDEEGRFRLEIPEAEIETSSSIWGFAPGFTLSGSARNRDGDTIIRMTPSEELTFEVVDPDGKQVSDVLVEPTHYRTKVGYDWIPVELAEQIQQRTDERGVVRFESLALSNLFQVKVTTEKYGVQTQRLQLKAGQPRHRTIKLRPCVPVTGRLVLEDLTGVKPEWISGVRVNVTTAKIMKGDESYPPFPTQGRAEAVTNEEGEFSIPLVAEGRVDMLYVLIDESVPVRAQLPDFIKLDGPKDLELPLVELVHIRGTVISSSGNPLKEEDIKLHIYYGNYRQGTDVFTDDDGGFEAWVMPGKIRFQPMNLFKTKYLQFGSPKPMEVPNETGPIEVPPIELVKAKPADGKLVSQETGKPMPDTKVIAYYDNWLCSSATTDAAGEFHLKKIPESVEADELTYRIVLGEEDYRHMRNGDVKIESDSPLVVSVKENVE